MRGAYLEISCAPDAQQKFDRGFYFLHNMDYVAARRNFEEGTATHGTCAMLHWGVAMTYFQPLWPGQPTKDSLTKGAAAVARAKQNSASATAKERDYVAAVAAYYENWDKTDTPARAKAWNAAQKRLADRYPDDVEAQAFWALSRLTVVDRKDKTYSEPLAVAEHLQKLLEKRPEHPGIMHYLLHAYDNPAYAQRAISVTTKYGAVSPDAAHALHMPSHIHVRLGNWTEVIEWNIKSADAAAKRPVDGRISRDWVHATDYMVYAYLQVGDDAHARAALDKIHQSNTYELNHGPGAYGLAATPARFATERRNWKEAAALVPKKVDYNWDQYPWALAVTYAAQGLGAARIGDVNTAEKAVAELDRLKPLVENPWWQGRVQIDRDVVAGWIAFRKKDLGKAERLLRGASEREMAAGKDNVEPGHVIYAIEELGDFLLQRKRPKEALEAFKMSLEDSPGRFNGLYGAGLAAEQAKLTDEAKTYYKQLVEMSPASKRPARAHAEAFLAKNK